jgi:DNA-binding NarL/FixJ family response regulator
MMNSVIIASNANFLVDALREKLKEFTYRVYSAAADDELKVKINEFFPRFIFLEHCFHGCCTDGFVQQFKKKNHNIKIVVWAASEVKPIAAARFIAAGADSYFSLRDSYQNIKNILYRISEGESCYPDDVEAVLDRDCAYPVIGKELTKREIQIAKLLTAGKRNYDICKILSLTIHTVKRHKLRIYQKYGVDNPIEILITALKHRAISLDDIL